MSLGKISIVGSCYNEADNIEELITRITEVMKNEKYEYEIVLSDNASTDGTDAILRKLAQDDKRIKVILNNRNYGPRLSPKNALKHCSGEIVIALATDLQDPPELISQFIRKREEGYLIALGQKKSSAEGKIKYSLRHLYYRLLKLFSDKSIIEHISGIIMLDKKVLAEVITLDPDTSFQFVLPGMGYEIALIPYDQKKRGGGKSSYSVFSYFFYAVESLMATSVAPLRVFVIMGVVISFISILIGLFYLGFKIKYWRTFNAGIAPLVIGIFFLGGIQIFMIGLIGEYVSSILKKVTKQLPVIEKELINFNDE